jgi:hypothetical protein
MPLSLLWHPLQDLENGSEPDTRDPRARSYSDRAFPVFDALSSHALESPLGLFVLAVGVWLIGRIGWWIVWKHSD